VKRTKPNSNSNYNARIFKKSSTANKKPFVVKDTKRETALMAAVKTLGNVPTKEPVSKVLDIADCYYEWLNKK